ncbi:MAG: ABC transporter substrate-binding protein, partial [Betaproteobacteria bacterium]|nr:ABC transporter substrate-binding protein [Betaproteobacteria bacterium]
QESAENTEKIPGALGTSTLAQLLTEKRALKVLDFNGVKPSVETMRNGRYPYYKRMFLVIGPRASATAREFAAFVQSPAARGVLARVGYWVVEPKPGR